MCSVCTACMCPCLSAYIMWQSPQGWRGGYTRSAAVNCSTLGLPSSCVIREWGLGNLWPARDHEQLSHIGLTSHDWLSVHFSFSSWGNVHVSVVVPVISVCCLKDKCPASEALNCSHSRSWWYIGTDGPFFWMEHSRLKAQFAEC